MPDWTFHALKFSSNHQTYCKTLLGLTLQKFETINRGNLIPLGPHKHNLSWPSFPSSNCAVLTSQLARCCKVPTAISLLTVFMS